MPPELLPYCTEKPLYLPHCYQVSDRQREVAPTPPRSKYGLPDDAFVFCSFNNNHKFTPEMYGAWMRILNGVPGSLLWLLADNETCRANLLAAWRPDAQWMGSVGLRHSGRAYNDPYNQDTHPDVYGGVSSFTFVDLRGSYKLTPQVELALGVGRVGVALFALQLLATLGRGVGAVLQPKAGLWAPAFLATFALYTLSESHALQANNIFWIIYVAVAARLALDARQAQ